MYTPLPSPYMLHGLPISFFLILSLAQYWVRSMKLLSATTSCPWRHTNTCCSHRYNAVADDSCAGSHLLRRIRHSLSTEGFEKVKCFGPIHTLRSLPDQGGDVCKVWFRNVNLYKVQTNFQLYV
jgi:hypothetical protein